MTQFRPSFLYACALHLPVQSHNSDPDSDLNPHSDPDLVSDPDQASDLDLDSGMLSDQNQWFMDPFVQKSCAQAVQRMEQLISKPFLPLIAEKVLKTAMMALRTAMKVSVPTVLELEGAKLMRCKCSPICLFVLVASQSYEISFGSTGFVLI